MIERLEDGRFHPYVMDFGLARETSGADQSRSGAIEGTPRFMAPEQARRIGLTQRLYRRARKHGEAVKAAEEAERESPWLYEARKLIGDIELERALEARDRGKEEAAREAFGRAVKADERASEVGRSDWEVYQGLAEAWVRQIEMAATKEQATESAYAAAMEASDKRLAAEPGSVAGHLKKAYAGLMTMAGSGAGTTSAERVKQCLAEAKAVLEKEPDNPYARDVATDCNAFAAEGAAGRGESPEPLLRTAISLLEPALRRYPHFLWGWNDLAGIHISLGA